MLLRTRREARDIVAPLLEDDEWAELKVLTRTRQAFGRLSGLLY